MKEVYDIVIIGGGTNSLSIAGYLSKCGLSVCICEERCECGGGAENAEPMPGCRIDPHATYLYGGAAPAFEQLELHKFGFRMVSYQNMMGGIYNNGDGFVAGGDMDKAATSLAKFSPKDPEVMLEMASVLSEPANLAKVLRSIYWTPPPPPHIQLRSEELPWSKVFRELDFGLYDDSWNQMSTFELLDNLFETEALKVGNAMATWYNGPHPSWKGTAVPGFFCNHLVGYSRGKPRGGMHALTHALVRCALFHGAKIFTNSKVEEIIVEDGEAKGVILADDATARNRRIYAKQAVISNTHVQPTFLDLVPARELEPGFIERVKGININGGSLFVLSLVTREMPKFKGDADELLSDGNYGSCLWINVDSREAMLNMERDVHTLKTHPIKPENMIIPLVNHDVYDPTHCTAEGYHVFSPIYLQVPPPEYHRDGPLAVNDAKWEIAEAMLEKIRNVAPNMTDKNIVAKYVNTPYDSSLRNLAFVGGNWMGISQEEEQWYEQKPLPELARYRTPIDRLYLGHQSSYPGGLCLQAVSYNLMHILIEDLGLEPGEWWYPSEHFIPSDA
ncbi:MAG: NAD(P)/FAD-dependent oxidoreductase [Proteobacteria bacterium]|nr:NAD(P)/FAD-dependent oxidoreductase [Pseudomonadota bacterium]